MTDLTPAQQAALDQLRSGDRPEWPASLRSDLESGVAAALAPAIAELEGQRLTITKRLFTVVAGCERSVHDDWSRPFAWTAARARGTVVHKAVELWLGVDRHVPAGTLVEHALALVRREERGLGRWLTREATDTDLAELRLEAGRLFTAFTTTFPRPPAAWSPVAEASMLHEHGPITLSAKADIALGEPRGPVAGRTVLELKTGRPRHEHRTDLAWYALLEALRCGVPPFRVGVAYADTGQLETWDVDQAMLDQALDLLARAALAAAQLYTLSRQPEPRPGPLCRWCPLLTEGRCPEGASWADAHGWDC